MSRDDSTRPQEDDDPIHIIPGGKSSEGQQSHAEKVFDPGVSDGRAPDSANSDGVAIAVSFEQPAERVFIRAADADLALPNGGSSDRVKEMLDEDIAIDDLGALDDDGGGADALDSSQGSTEGEQDYPEVFDSDLRRVKVYELVGSRWTDRGTAFCSGDFDEATQQAKLVARSESDQNTIILSCAIRASDVYQRQQETLIVWTEPDGTDFALSFQDVEGCTEVWEFILEVQRHLGTRGLSSYTTQEIIRSGRLPQPEAGIIAEIEKAIRTLGRSPKTRENLSGYIQENNYIHSLIEIFRVAERAEDLKTLQSLCSCMQTILVLNEHQMYEHILSDELWMDVVGMLEYDPEFPKFKANYRDFLLQRTQYLQPIAIDDPIIQRKIHHTYRLQYLKDVILGRALDDATFNVLNSCIIFNQIDIINHVQNHDRFLGDLVSLFILPTSSKGKEKAKDDVPKDGESMDIDKPTPSGNPAKAVLNGSSSSSCDDQSSPGPGPFPKSREDSDARRREIILLLHQLCQIGKNVQLPARIALFRTLVERGVLYAIQWALCRPEDRQLVNTAGEILSILLDHHIGSVRNHVIMQAIQLGQPLGSNEDGDSESVQLKLAGPEMPKEVPNPAAAPFQETIVQVLCRMLPNSDDLALQCQLAECLRILFDVPQSDGTSESQSQSQFAIGTKLLQRQAKDDPSVENFLENFYKVAVGTLFRPLLTDIPEFQELEKSGPLNPSRDKGNLYLYLCDLLCSFAIQHSFRSFFFILSSKISAHVASLLNVRDKHLCLASLRFFRICLKVNNSNLYRHLDRVGIFAPIVDLTTRESRRNNLLSSTCQDFFETIRKEQLRVPILSIMRQREAKVKELAEKPDYSGASIFSGLHSRYEIYKEGPPKEDEEEKEKKKPTFSLNGALNGRIFDSAEEAYFGIDDSTPSESRISDVPPSQKTKLRLSVPRDSIPIQIRNRGRQVPSQPRPVSPLSSLLDYDEEEEDVISPVLEHSEAATPASLNLPPQQIEILPYDPSESDSSSDTEDAILDELVSRPKAGEMTHKEQATESKGLLDMPERLREKRRRNEEDEEDEMLERLVSKSRRLSNASLNDPKSRGPVSAVKSDDGRKRLTLKFNAGRGASSAQGKASNEPTSRAELKDAEKG